MTIKFTDLLKKYYKVKTSTALSKKILENVDLDIDNLRHVQYLELHKLLPDMKFITSSLNNGIVYMGRECEYNVAEIYKYDNYFVTFKFSGNGNEENFDVDILNDHEYTGSNEKQIIQFLNDLDEHMNVTEKMSDETALDMLNNVNPLSLQNLIDYFKHTYGGDEGCAKLLEYVNDIYN